MLFKNNTIQFFNLCTVMAGLKSCMQSDHYKFKNQFSYINELLKAPYQYF